MKEIRHIIPHFLIGIIFLLPSCIYPYEPDILASDTRILVVEGQITDETGPFCVKLSNTFDFNNTQLYGEPETGAEVQIFDDKGNLFSLYYTSGGWYKTEDTLLQGVTGNTYTLNITTADGTQYESSPVLMQDVPDIDSVYFKEVNKTRFEDGEAIDENWLDIFVDSHDETGQTKYWKWDYEETWEVRIPTDSLLIQYGSDPNNAYYTTENVNVNEKNKYCWITRFSNNILIKSQDKVSNTGIKQISIKSISPNSDRLHIKYSINIKQTALSKNIYEFWEKLQETNEETGDIYEKIPEQIFGNIDCCDGKGKALGYFSASAVKTKRIFIIPSEHQIKTINTYSTCFYIIDPEIRTPHFYFGTTINGERVYTYDKYCSDCREYGTNVKPDFWE